MSETMTKTETPTLYDELTELHSAYTVAINHALDAGDTAAAEELAKGYDDDAWELVAAREGKTHLLRELRSTRRKAPGSRLARWLDDYTRWAFNPQPPLVPAARERVAAAR